MTGYRRPETTQTSRFGLSYGVDRGSKAEAPAARHNPYVGPASGCQTAWFEWVYITIVCVCACVQQAVAWALVVQVVVRMPLPINNRHEARSLAEQRRLLPVHAHRDEILYLVEQYTTTIVVGETGSGKTTQIPQYLHEAGGWFGRREGIWVRGTAWLMDHCWPFPIIASFASAMQ